MKRIHFATLAGLIALGWCIGASAAQEPYKRSFVSLAPGVPGLLYEPVIPGLKAQIAIVAMHNRADYLTSNPSVPCAQLAQRGYRALCANTSTSKSGFVADDNIDKMLLNVKAAVAYLRSYPGVTRVVLFGHSGGGALMAAYQNIAENGVAACQGAEKLIKCPDTLGGMPAADGLMLIDSTFGESMSLLHLDPSIVDEGSGQNIDSQLDMYNPANGFGSQGAHYSEQFKMRFLSAQRQRMDRLIAKAQQRLAKIAAGSGNYADDEPLIIPGYSTRGGKLFATDLGLWSHTRRAWPLLHPDGSVTTEIVRSVRVPTFLTSTTPSYANGSLTTTVRTFLGTMAMRASAAYDYDASSIRGIDYNSSYENTVNSVEGITKPLLQMGMTGSFEYFMAETVREHARSADKTLAYVEGAVHGFTPCTQCALARGLPADHYGDTVKTLFDYIDAWLSKAGRFTGTSQGE